MTETTDPREGLKSADVAVRTAAARELAAHGKFADVEVLVELAKTDKSPSVRLYAAAAAADIATRSEPGPAQRKRLVEHLFRAFDPGHNPSLLVVLAAVPDATGVERLGRLLRDPRSDVRSGAITALRRMSARPGSEKLLAGAVRGFLEAGKHPPDAVAELVRLAGEAGWTGMEDVIRASAARGRAAATAAAQALEWLAARQDPTSWTGTWAAVNEDGTVDDWLYLESSRVWGAAGELGELAVKDGIGTVEGLPPLRRIWVPKGGDEAHAQALETEERSYWRQSGKGLAAVIEDLDAKLAAVPVAALGMARELAPLEGVSTMRARAIALWRGGELAEAEKVAQALSAGERKPNPHVQWITANVKLGLGDLDAARDSLRIAIQGAPKKAPWKEEAEKLLASLRG